MSNTIEAKLRIAADLARARAEVRALAKELRDTGQAAKEANEASKGGEQGSEQASKSRAQARADERAAARAARDEERKARAEKKAADQAAAEDERKRKTAERETARQAAADLKASNAARQKQVLLGQQMTDVTVGLATGQNPLTIMLQQGGQIRDIYGSVGAGFKAVTAVLTPMRIGIGLAAAGLATFVYQAVQGAIESDRLNKTLALTGNIAGTSAGHVHALAKDIASRQRASVGDVRETLQGLIATGQYTGATLDVAGRAVTSLRKATGGTADEVIKQFDGMAENVSAWAEKSNKAYHYLTADQIKYIRTLQSQGRDQEAMRVTMTALSDTLDARMKPAIGAIERAWRGAGNAISFFVDQFKGLGRDSTPEEKLAKAKLKLQELIDLQEQMRAGRGRGGKRASTIAPAIEAAQADVDQQQKALALQAQRDADRRHAQEQQQEDAYRAGLAFQTLLADQKAALAARGAAQELAQLDKQQSAVELAYARGEISASEHALKLNAIDQARLREQEAMVKFQLDLERRKLDATSKPEERLQIDSSIKRAEAQLVEVRARIRTAEQQGEALSAADILATARARAEDWAKVWGAAFEQVRKLRQDNEAASAELIKDPKARANAEAAVKAAEVRKAIEDQVRDVKLQIDLAVTPEARKALQETLKQLQDEGKKAVDETTRRAVVGSLQAQAAEIMDRIRTAEAAIAQQEQLGALTSVEAERQKLEVRAKEIEQLQKLLALLQATAKTEAERNAIEQLRQNLVGLQDTSTDLEKTMRSSISGGFGKMFSDIMTGSERALDSFRSFVAGVARAALDLIGKELGQELARSLMPKAGVNGGGGNWLSTAASWIASLFHTGGVVGAGGGMARTVSPLLFASAQVLHSGGIAGLASNEVPAILQRGEEVLTADDPRHQRNWRGGASIGAVNVSVSVDGASGGTTQAQGRALGSALEAAVIDVLERESRPGGILARR